MLVDIVTVLMAITLPDAFLRGYLSVIFNHKLLVLVVIIGLLAHHRHRLFRLICGLVKEGGVMTAPGRLNPEDKALLGTSCRVFRRPFPRTIL